MDLVPPVQTDEQPKASPRVEGMLVDPSLESLGAWQHMREPVDIKQVSDSTLGNGGHRRVLRSRSCRYQRRAGIWSGESCGAEGADDAPRGVGGHGRTRYPATEPPGGASGYSRGGRGGGD